MHVYENFIDREKGGDPRAVLQPAVEALEHGKSVVIRNALDALPNRKMVVRPAEVAISVLKPVPGGRWTASTVAANARRIRQSCLAAPGQVDG